MTRSSEKFERKSLLLLAVLEECVLLIFTVDILLQSCEASSEED
jgi:hypothetical protein